MKIATAFVLILALFVIAQPSYAQVCVQLQNNLYPGARDASVSELQRFLQSTGDYTDTNITGSYGLSTQQAVQRFQARMGIISSGTPGTTGYGAVGPATRQAINAYCARQAPSVPITSTTAPAAAQTPASTVSPTSSTGSTLESINRTLTIGASGTDVRALQEFLAQTGDYTFPSITGYFGPVTQQAVQRFQARTGVVSSGTPATTGFGLVGPATRARLAAERALTSERPPAPQPPITPTLDTTTPPPQNVVQPPHISTTPLPSTNPDQPIIVPGPSLSESQISSVIALLESYGMPRSPYAEEIRALLRGQQPPPPTSNYPAFSLSAAQLESITSLLARFGASQTTIQQVENILKRGSGGGSGIEHSILTEAQILSTTGLLRNFGASTVTIGRVETVLRGRIVTDTSPSGTQLSDNQIGAVLSLLNNFGAPQNIIDRINVILSAGKLSGIPEQPVQLSLTASRTSIVMGESVTLSWSAENASACSAPQLSDSGKFDPNQPIQRSVKGSVTVTPPYVGRPSYVIGCRSAFFPDHIEIRSVIIEVKEKNVSGANLLIDGYNVSFPEVVVDPQQRSLLFFSGHLTPEEGVRGSNIYVAPNCPNQSQTESLCNSGIKKIFDSQTLGFTLLDNPTVVKNTDAQGRDYYLMYMHGRKPGSSDGGIYYATSWVDDGMNWSSPQPLLKNSTDGSYVSYRYPSALRAFGDFGEILLFVEQNRPDQAGVIRGKILLYRLGNSGIELSEPIEMSLPDSSPPWGFSVRYACEKGCYYLMHAAQEAGTVVRQYILSVQNLNTGNWQYWGNGTALRRAGNEAYIQTPFHQPSGYRLGNIPYMYYAATRTTGAQLKDFKIYMITYEGAQKRTSTLQRVFDSFTNAADRGVRAVANAFSAVFGIFGR